MHTMTAVDAEFGSDDVAGVPTARNPTAVPISPGVPNRPI
jgi:hypothetical protein